MTTSIELVSHASVLIEGQGLGILTDPWFEGGAFNDSWALHPNAVNPPDLARVTHLWISHEHPDHFHVPTLRSFPDDFKRRVKVLFQRISSRKMVEAFQRFGFSDIIELDHRRQTTIGDGVEAYLYQVGQMDSCLRLNLGGSSIMNVNDAAVSDSDARLILRDVGPSDVVLNQFSYAGYNGDPHPEQVLPAKAATVLDSMVRVHRGLGARTTIPFASFVRFCMSDNEALNRHVNTPRDVKRRFEREGLDVQVMYPGDRWTVGLPREDEEAISRFDQDFDRIEEMPTATAPIIDRGRIEDAFGKLRGRVQKLFPDFALLPLRPVVVEVPDLGTRVRFTLRTGDLRFDVNDDPDLVVNSQPLWFAFAFPFGVQTLGVSGRYVVRKNRANWHRHRILFALQNAELGIRPSVLFQPSTLRMLWDRREGAARQLRSRLRQMGRGF